MNFKNGPVDHNKMVDVFRRTCPHDSILYWDSGRCYIMDLIPSLAATIPYKFELKDIVNIPRERMIKNIISDINNL